MAKPPLDCSVIWIYIQTYGVQMSSAAQKKAIESHRSRLAARGIVRFEIQALEADRELVRALARKLADGGAEARELRRAVRQAVAGPPSTGGILAALRRSPLVGAELDLKRSREEGRKVDL